MMDLKIIAYSLYGDQPKYTYNCVANILLAEKLFPDWQIRVYYDDTVPQQIVRYLHRNKHVCPIDMTDHWLTKKDKMLWRNLAIDEREASVVCIRDCDSWLSTREKGLVDEWLTGQNNLHIIRDHCYHSKHMMGGMWGAKGALLREMKMEDTMRAYLEKNVNHRTHTGDDQDFLRDNYYFKYKDQALVHMGHQYDRMHRDVWTQGGYFPGEHTKLIPDSPVAHGSPDDEPVPGLSFLTAHIINKFNCMHCGLSQHVYIGAMFNTMSKPACDTIMHALQETN